MKIICTKQEKEDLLDAATNSDFCPLGHFNCLAICCRECFEDFVEWEVTDDDHKM